MKCYLVRHGKDDDTVRGGWSNSPLLEEGVEQVTNLARSFAVDHNIIQIFTSDLLRARQSAEILSQALGVPVTEMPEFRETNNGVLAGMKNELANENYPGLYWNTLGWDERYPGGESPHEFFDRVSSAWCSFKKKLQAYKGDIILITHAGVINVIRCIENGTVYSNKKNMYPIGNAEMVSVEI